jgi:hypothetical protein
MELDVEMLAAGVSRRQALGGGVGHGLGGADLGRGRRPLGLGRGIDQAEDRAAEHQRQDDDDDEDDQAADGGDGLGHGG